MRCRFNSHIGVIVLNILCNGFAHLWPPVVLGYKFIGSGSTTVTSSGVFIAGVEDLSLKLFNISNIQEFIDIEETIIIGIFPKGDHWVFGFKVLEGKEDRFSKNIRRQEDSNFIIKTD